MNPPAFLPRMALAAFLAMTIAIPASGHDHVSCDVPRSERQPSVQLQRQLNAAGWKVRKIQVSNGCYEVYGKDERGVEVETFFDPRTLNRISGN